MLNSSAKFTFGATLPTGSMQNIFHLNFWFLIEMNEFDEFNTELSIGNTVHYFLFNISSEDVYVHVCLLVCLKCLPKSWAWISHSWTTNTYWMIQTNTYSTYAELISDAYLWSHASDGFWILRTNIHYIIMDQSNEPIYIYGKCLNESRMLG